MSTSSLDAWLEEAFQGFNRKKKPELVDLYDGLVAASKRYDIAIEAREDSWTRARLLTKVRQLKASLKEAIAQEQQQPAATLSALPQSTGTSAPDNSNNSIQVAASEPLLQAHQQPSQALPRLQQQQHPQHGAMMPSGAEGLHSVPTTVSQLYQTNMPVHQSAPTLPVQQLQQSLSFAGVSAIPTSLSSARLPTSTQPWMTTSVSSSLAPHLSASATSGPDPPRHPPYVTYPTATATSSQVAPGTLVQLAGNVSIPSHHMVGAGAHTYNSSQQPRTTVSTVPSVASFTASVASNGASHPTVRDKQSSHSYIPIAKPEDVEPSTLIAWTDDGRTAGLVVKQPWAGNLIAVRRGRGGKNITFKLRCDCKFHRADSAREARPCNHATLQACIKTVFNGICPGVSCQQVLTQHRQGVPVAMPCGNSDCRVCWHPNWVTECVHCHKPRSFAGFLNICTYCKMACPSKRQAKKRSKAERPRSDAPLSKTSKPDFTAGTEVEKFAGILNLASQLKEAADAIGCPLLVLGCLPQQATGLPLGSAMLHSTCRIKNCEAPHLFSCVSECAVGQLVLAAGPGDRVMPAAQLDQESRLAQRPNERRNLLLHGFVSHAMKAEHKQADSAPDPTPDDLLNMMADGQPTAT